MGKKGKISHQSNKVSHVLAIETSCDDTSVAIVDSSGLVLAMKSQNQDLIHGPFGGIIPELASRNHTMQVLPLMDEVFKTASFGWEKIDAIAVTYTPGLLGSLLVGLTVAKTLSVLHKKPLIGVNHLEGHLYAPFLKDNKFNLNSTWDEPFLGLCVSGGHTSLVRVDKFRKIKTLGRTLDDAAGEAFDKFGKVLGLGYPAGKKMDELAKKGNVKAFNFPRPLIKSNDFNFSFSGLKTAGMLKFKELENKINGDVLNDLCASYQEAIVDVLSSKVQKAVKKTRIKKVVVTGGVAANSALRERLRDYLFPPPYYCADNAAMIGFVGAKKFEQCKIDGIKLKVAATTKNAEIKS
ncbi:MAG: tRNA (adenosine(37)-N6)-threonylcarbamoyltransferase complex transferase subunit TsaD [Oligoflexia bacterium]|nr:tRNA (adenosine(37)-N6)-threonylcarbamoyltransferase complex transferase subunit TsaD [Oligoflexia bacterium]